MAASCADNQNMYEAMRYASMLSKVQTPDPRFWATSDEVYKAATVGSAKALGFKDLGAIAPGYKADIVFLDLGSINWIPHNWSTNQIVHTEDGGGVKHVMIGGRFIFRDGRHTDARPGEAGGRGRGGAGAAGGAERRMGRALHQAGAGGRQLLPGHRGAALPPQALPLRFACLNFDLSS